MKPERPEYQIPDVAKEELALSRQMAGARMPGIGYAEDRIRQGGATSLYNLRRGAANPNQLLSGVAGVQVASNAAERSLLEAEAGDQYRRLANLSKSLSMMGQYKDKEFELNKMQPYMDKSRTKAALTQSGLLNTFGGLGDVTGSAMQKYYMQNLFGGSNATGNYGAPNINYSHLFKSMLP